MLDNYAIVIANCYAVPKPVSLYVSVSPLNWNVSKPVNKGQTVFRVLMLGRCLFDRQVIYGTYIKNSTVKPQSESQDERTQCKQADKKFYHTQPVDDY